jgi:magnesium chelatase subunit D
VLAEAAAGATAAEVPPGPTLPVWPLALAAAAALAVDPAGLGGAVIRAPAGPVRERWQAALRQVLPAAAPWRRIPLHVNDSRLLGGLDLTATLKAGRPVAERGLLAEADGGLVLLPMGERVSAATAARLTAALDAGEVALERDGLTLRSPARFGVVLFDEGDADDERPPAGLLDRLAFHLDLLGVSWSETTDADFAAHEIAAARRRLPRVHIPDAALQALTTTAAALGIASLRAPLLALRAARAACALDGRLTVNEDDAEFAAGAVLAPRATCWPAPADDRADHEQPPPEADAQSPDSRDDARDRPLEDVILEAALAAIPPRLLAQLQFGGLSRSRAPASGRSGQVQQGRLRGRPAGTRRGELRHGQRLNVVETLRAAAPWQPLRRRQRGGSALPARIEVRPDDFRISRFRHRTQTTTIFVVDASGSAALHRLAEAKGAVELLLADCYVRRDRVALIAFRGQGAEVVLSPTRSLVRAKRSLAGLPGGGGTPLATGIDLAAELAASLARRGDAPVLIVLTDGRANVARDGKGGRAAAQADALAAARLVRAANVASLLIDTSPRPEPQAECIAAAMGARYLPLPHADARTVSRAARAAAEVGG